MERTGVPDEDDDNVFVNVVALADILSHVPRRRALRNNCVAPARVVQRIFIPAGASLTRFDVLLFSGFGFDFGSI